MPSDQDQLLFKHFDIRVPEHQCPNCKTLLNSFGSLTHQEVSPGLKLLRELKESLNDPAADDVSDVQSSSLNDEVP